MPVGDLVDRDLLDGRAIHERAGRNQNLAEDIDADGVPGRDVEVAGWAAFTKRMCHNANWLNILRDEDDGGSRSHDDRANG